MLIEALIRNAQQVAIKALLPDSTLVAADEQDGLALCIESVRYTPCASIRIKTQFLHIRVARTFECVCQRSSEQRTILAQDNCRCLQLLTN